MKKTWLAISRGFLLAGVMIGCVDLLFLLFSKQMFFDGGELFRGMAFTFGIDIGLGIVFGLVCTLLSVLLGRIYDSLGWRTKVTWQTFASGSLLLGPAVFVWLKLFSGPKARQVQGRVLIAVGLGALCALFTGFVLSALPRFAKKSESRRRAVLLAAIAAGLLAMLADAWVLVRLYPIFHATLTVVAVTVTGLGFTIGLKPPTSRKTFLLLTAMVFGLLVAAIVSLVAVSRTQNVRFVIGYVTPSASDVVSILKGGRSGAMDAAVELGEIESPKSAGNALSLPGADVFLITVDAMRYDRLAAMGARRAPAPNLDKFSKSSVLFTRAYTAVPHTSYALTSLLTGKYTRPLFDVPGAPEIHETWPEVMRRFRYDTAGFFTPAVFFIDRARFEPYLRTGLGFTFRKVEAAHTAAQRTATLLEYLEDRQDKSRPVFAWIHYFEPHEPYDTACTRFGTESEDRYDCEIWTVDKAVGTLLAYIDAAHPRAVVIISSDHGEEFGDHGGRYHGTTLFDEQVRVPLMMRIPGVSARQLEAPVSLVDLMGTVLRIVDIPSPARIRSRDLTGVILDGETQIDAFAEAHDEAMLVYEGYKEICNVKTDLCRLYDLKNDPGETRSTAERDPARTAEMEKRIAAWRQSFARHELRPVSTDKNAEKWPDAVQRALGGDVSVLDDLLAVTVTSKEGTIRRKAAELAFRIAETAPKNIPATTDELDVEVSAWLNALSAKFGDKAAAERLATNGSVLDPACDAYRAVALVRAEIGDNGAYDSLMTLALDDGATITDRIKALHFLGGMERRATAERLIPLIDNYQLTLDAAKTLSALKVKGAVAPLCARLKRERFLERKAALINALADLGDWRAVSAVADELYNETPPPNALSALSLMADRSPFGRRLPSDTKGRESVFYNPAPREPIKVFLKEVNRVVLRTASAADGGVVIVSCGGQEMGRLPLTAGSSEGFVNLAACEKRTGKPFEIAFTIQSELSDTAVEMTAVLGK